MSKLHHDERLRIVPEDLWLAVKRRQEKQSAVIGARVRRGLSRAAARSTGRGPRYLLSGLLRCGTCGASLIVSGTHAGGFYACSTRVNGGTAACANDVRVARPVVENLLLDDLRTSLLDPGVVREVCTRVRKRLRTPAPAVTPAQVRTVEAEIANLTDAVAAGLLKSSPALAGRLAAAETELARLHAARTAPGRDVERMVAGIEARYARLVRDLDRALLDRHGDRGRAELRTLLGEYKVEADARKIRFYNVEGRHEAALLRAVGADVSEVRNYGSGGRFAHSLACHFATA